MTVDEKINNYIARAINLTRGIRFGDQTYQATQAEIAGHIFELVKIIQVEEMNSIEAKMSKLPKMGA